MNISSFIIYICCLSLLQICLNKRTIINSFQTKVFSFLSKENAETNIVFSPLSLYQVLSLVSNGARGSTEYEIIHAIDNNNQVDQNLENFRLINKNKTSIILANAVLSTFPLSDLYMEISYKFKAFISELKSVEQVNQWCYEKSNGTIKEIISDITNVVLLLLNAVYFKGEWEHKFELHNTYNSTFTNIDNSLINVEMMKQSNIFNYYEDSIVQVFEMEYKVDNMTAVIILPHEGYKINDYIENNFNETTIKGYLNNMTKQEIEIHLPKFTIESSFNFNKILQQLGIKRAFNKTAADFWILSPHGQVYISNVLQKTFLKVNEEGTEASAVTAVVFDELSIPIEKKVIVNRPFVFIIRDKEFEKKHPFIAKIVNLNNEK